jgi:hypothetical protein
MRTRRRFRPTGPDELEGRVVLSPVGLRPRTALVGRLTDRLQASPRARRLTISARVEQAFASFAEEYGRARETYFDLSATGDARESLRIFTIQRVNVLAQQVINALIRSPRSTMRESGSPDPLPQFINRRISDQGADSNSLARGLLSSLPPADSTRTTAALFVQAQDSAIQAARTAVLNGITLLRNRNDGKGSK